MNKRDWHNIYHKWLKSQKLKELRADYLKKNANMIISDKDEIIQEINTMYEYHLQTDEDKQAYNWLLTSNKEELMSAYRTVILKWTINLKHYEQREEFEVCAHLRDLMDMEVYECVNLLENYFQSTKEDIETIMSLQHFSRDIVDARWDYANNKLKGQI